MEVTFAEKDVAVVNPGDVFGENEIRWVMEEITTLFDKKVSCILFDLSGLEQIRSSAAAVFVGLVGIAREKGSKIAILNTAMSVREVFDVLGVAAVIPVYPSIEEALEGLREDKPVG
jgi:anti-anti-sigma factor